MDNKYNALISYSHSADMALAEALETALEKFAKPTFKRRALHIFRDSNDLSISPDLWGKIEEGLDQSEYFICLASPGHAKSHYCGEEVKYWLSQKGTEKFLIVLTGGELQWNHDTSDFDWEKTTAVSKILSGTFKNEPLYVDFRDEIPEDQLNLDNPKFKDKMVYIAATIHGKAVGDMVGEAVKQHKRTIRIRNAAVAVVMSLMALALFLTIMSNRRKDASLLHFQAIAMENEDPTVALRLEEEALKIYDNPEFEKSARSIINRNTFYKIIRASDSVHVPVISISPVDNTILLADDTGIITVLNQTGDYVRSFKAHDSSVTAVAYSPKGKLVLTGAEDGARLWDLEGNLKQELKLASVGYNPIRSVAFSPDGKLMLTAAYNGAHLWDIQGNLLTELYSEMVQSVAISPDGQSVLLGFEGAKVVAALMDLEGNYKLSLQNYGYSFGEANNTTNSVAFSPDGQSLLTGSYDDTAALWDLEGNLKQVYNNMITGGGSRLSARFSPDGKMILAGTTDNAARLWNLEGNVLKELQGHQGEIYSLAFSSDGSFVISSSEDGTVRKWNLKGLRATRLATFGESDENITSVAFSPDGQAILGGLQNGTTRLWDNKNSLIREFTGHKNRVSSVAFSPDGKNVLTGSDDGTIHLWDLEGDQKSELERHPAKIISTVFSPKSDSILTVSADGLVNIFDRNGTILNEFMAVPEGNLGSAGIGAIAFSSNRKKILTGNYRNALLWDLEGNLIKSYEGGQASSFLRSTTSVAFAPDGQTILSGSSDGTASLWDLEGQLLKEFLIPEESIIAVGFTPDGQAILTVSGEYLRKLAKVDGVESGGSGKGIGRLWDLEGTLIMEFNKNGVEPGAIAFAPDSESFVASYPEGSKAILYQNIRLEDFLDVYLQTFVQPLSEAQKEAFKVD
ncbi:MAG: TIR domain-containing protein [Flavobacteriaceae bacterium]